LAIDFPSPRLQSAEIRYRKGFVTMKKLVLAVLAASAIGMQASIVLAATTPCESVLKDLRAAAAKAKLSDVDKAKVADLENKGIERCNADDDKRADDFFAQAMKVVGK
jgi:hypothetical protein